MYSVETGGVAFACGEERRGNTHVAYGMLLTCIIKKLRARRRGGQTRHIAEVLSVDARRRKSSPTRKKWQGSAVHDIWRTSSSACWP